MTIIMYIYIDVYVYSSWFYRSTIRLKVTTLPLTPVPRVHRGSAVTWTAATMETSPSRALKGWIGYHGFKGKSLKTYRMIGMFIVA